MSHDDSEVALSGSAACVSDLHRACRTGAVVSHESLYELLFTQLGWVKRDFRGPWPPDTPGMTEIVSREDPPDRSGRAVRG